MRQNRKHPFQGIFGDAKRQTDKLGEGAFGKATNFVARLGSVEYFKQTAKWDSSWGVGTELDSWTASFTHAARKRAKAEILERQKGGTYSVSPLYSYKNAIEYLKILVETAGRLKQVGILERQIKRQVEAAANAQMFEEKFLSMTDSVKARIKEDALLVALCLLLSDQKTEGRESLHSESISISELLKDSRRAWEPWDCGYGSAGCADGKIYSFREAKPYERQIAEIVDYIKNKEEWIAEGRRV